MSDKLKELMNKLSDEPFEYGVNDCFTFTNALVKEFHGRDYRKLHPYKTEEEAREHMKDFGIEGLTLGTLGYAIQPTSCKDGDVVSAMVAKGEVALGFVWNGKALFKTRKRSISLPLSRCRLGWSIK
jgi:hypothetical protein